MIELLLVSNLLLLSTNLWRRFSELGACCTTVVKSVRLGPSGGDDEYPWLRPRIS